MVLYKFRIIIIIIIIIIITCSTFDRATSSNGHCEVHLL